MENIIATIGVVRVVIFDAENHYGITSPVLLRLKLMLLLVSTIIVVGITDAGASAITVELLSVWLCYCERCQWCRCYCWPCKCC